VEGLSDRGDGGRVDGAVGKEHLDAVLLILVAHRPVALEAHAIGWNALLGEPGQRGRGHLPEQRVELLLQVSEALFRVRARAARGRHRCVGSIREGGCGGLLAGSL